MSEPTTSETFDALRAFGKAKRKRNQEFSTQMLRDLGIEFEERNDGAHLIVLAGGHRINFWPSTGKFQLLDGSYERGVRNLIRYLEDLSK